MIQRHYAVGSEDTGRRQEPRNVRAENGKDLDFPLISPVEIKS